MGQFYRNVVLKIIGENWNAKYAIAYMLINYQACEMPNK